MCSSPGGFAAIGDDYEFAVTSNNAFAIAVRGPMYVRCLQYSLCDSWRVMLNIVFINHMHDGESRWSQLE